MGTETARGKRITIRFDGDRCIHSRNCVLGNPNVFVPGADGEWLHPDAASPNEIEAIVRSCPSGALTFSREGSDEESTEERAPEINTVRTLEHGPLYFHAEMVMDGESQPFRATLCRCGLSKRKPWCDNSHKDSAFQATGEPDEKKSRALSARNGPLQLAPQKNGPLKVSGNLEIVSGTGRTIDRVTETWFCRCGHSKNKPFCDGSHRKAGFEAEGEDD